MYSDLPDIKQHMADLIRKYRENKNLLQKQLAAQWNCSVIQIRRYESRKYQFKLSRAIFIAKEIGCSLEQLANSKEPGVVPTQVLPESEYVNNLLSNLKRLQDLNNERYNQPTSFTKKAGATGLRKQLSMSQLLREAALSTTYLQDLRRKRSTSLRFSTIVNLQYALSDYLYLSDQDLSLLRLVER